MTAAAKDDCSKQSKNVAVIGAGVSGLAAAYKLKSNGVKVTVFEAEGRAGGKLRSVSHHGLIWEEGANTMTESEVEVKSLLDDLGLREKQQFPIAQNKRYIVRNGMPVLVCLSYGSLLPTNKLTSIVTYTKRNIPTNPVALIKSNFLSSQSKLQIILEPFLWKKKEASKVSDNDMQESVGEFFQRHFGKEVVDYLIDPFVAGTSGGDPESLSARHNFPDVWNLEKRFGSIIAGAVKTKLSAKKEKNEEIKGSSEKKKRQHGSFSFIGGMQDIDVWPAYCPALQVKASLAKMLFFMQMHGVTFLSTDPICNEFESSYPWLATRLIPLGGYQLMSSGTHTRPVLNQGLACSSGASRSSGGLTVVAKRICKYPTLTDTLCTKLGKDGLKLESKVLSLSYCHDGKSPLENWSVSYASKGGKHAQASSYDAVIMTIYVLIDHCKNTLCVPAFIHFAFRSWMASYLVSLLNALAYINISAPLCNVKEMNINKGRNLFPLDFLPQMSYMPLSVIITTFKKEDVKRPLEGFGVLVPSKEQQNGLKTLGTLFSSMMFPDRAPKDLHLYTTFVGGSRNKELAKASTDDLKAIVTSDLRQLLGVEGEPKFVNHYYWSKPFPTYGRNYDLVLEAIEKMEKNLPGFFYAGNHKGGLSVGKAIASGCNAADLVISYLESSADDKMLEEGPQS
ncbi:unnamed protein product [Dovyalis caffra]|uniref:Protoporphyrinogen oxidase n=1 Tax=Dovyalis caffra TaxID=77055 RepID=A0AAV1R5M1_9ROSI|nr:unnamed protein product [Dovyalis caffra]